MITQQWLPQNLLTTVLGTKQSRTVATASRAFSPLHVKEKCFVCIHSSHKEENQQTDIPSKDCDELTNQDSTWYQLTDLSHPGLDWLLRWPVLSWCWWSGKRLQQSSSINFATWISVLPDDHHCHYSILKRKKDVKAFGSQHDMQEISGRQLFMQSQPVGWCWHGRGSLPGTMFVAGM